MFLLPINYLSFTIILALLNKMNLPAAETTGYQICCSLCSLRGRDRGEWDQHRFN